MYTTIYWSTFDLRKNIQIFSHHLNLICFPQTLLFNGGIFKKLSFALNKQIRGQKSF